MDAWRKGIAFVATTSGRQDGYTNTLRLGHQQRVPIRRSSAEWPTVASHLGPLRHLSRNLWSHELATVYADAQRPRWTSVWSKLAPILVGIGCLCSSQRRQRRHKCLVSPSRQLFSQLSRCSTSFRYSRVRRRAVRSNSWSSMFFSGNDQSPNASVSVMQKLQEIYVRRMEPLERYLGFGALYDLPYLSDAYFQAKPMVLVVGQYSTGKSTMISHMLQADYPGLRIGPEPTTDKFVAVMEAPEGGDSQQIPGFALVSDPSKPFAQLERFGAEFLQRLEGSLLPSTVSPVLHGISFVDTPGVLAGTPGNGSERGYDFEAVMGWFAENSDLVLVLFDSNKLDLSDEFRRCLTVLRRNEDKVRLVLNKAASLRMHELVRVYGALMWNLSSILQTPEMPRAYIGSFRGRELEQIDVSSSPSPSSSSSPNSADTILAHEETSGFLALEEEGLYREVLQLPLEAAMRKINDFVRRARKVRAHAVLVNHIAGLTGWWQRWQGTEERTFRRLFADPERLERVYMTVSEQHQIPLCDFPTPATIQAKVGGLGSYRPLFQRVPPELLANAHWAMTEEVPELMARVADERSENTRSFDTSRLKAEWMRSVGLGSDSWDPSEPQEPMQTEIPKGVGGENVVEHGGTQPRDAPTYTVAGRQGAAASTNDSEAETEPEPTQ